MKNEKQIRDYIHYLSKITRFIADYGSTEENDHPDYAYLCDLEDILNWILDDSALETLFAKTLIKKSGKIELLEIIKDIETRTGKKF